MAFCELPAFQITLSSSQGVAGLRRFLLTSKDAHDWRAFVKNLCDGHLGNDKDVVPVSVQIAPWSDLMIIDGGDPFATLPKVDKKSAIVVTAQYQYLHFETPWPIHIQKPGHPVGTTLTIQTRGSGQYLQLPPGSFVSKDETGGRQLALVDNSNAAQVIPIAEYHITCGRLLPSQVPWLKKWEGLCNSDYFLGERPETLLFDSWEIKPSFAPALTGKEAVRYDLTVVLRNREVPALDGGKTKYYGWNHAFFTVTDKKTGKTSGAWRKIMVNSKNGHHELYPPQPFRNLFFAENKSEELRYAQHLQLQAANGILNEGE